MIKTQIQIEEWQYDALKKRCSDMSRSMSDFIREALTDSLKREGTILPLSELAGKYEPISTDDLKSHDAGWIPAIR